MVRCGAVLIHRYRPADVARTLSLVFNAESTDTTMFTKCPTCGSIDVRRSSIRASEASARPRVRSPYRCRECGERFSVMSKRVYGFVGLLAFAFVAGAVAWNIVGSPQDRRPQAKTTEAVESSVYDAKLAESNDPAAEYKTAHMYMNGNGGSADKKRSLAWLERAASHGNTDAQFEYGNALREGFGVVQDYERAAKWLELAAEHGNADAQYALGQMYRAGMGVPADNGKAYMWFNLAAAQELSGASVQRDAVLRLLTSAQVLEAQAEARRLSDTAAKQTAVAP